MKRTSWDTPTSTRKDGREIPSLTYSFLLQHASVNYGIDQGSWLILNKKTKTKKNKGKTANWELHAVHLVEIPLSLSLCVSNMLQKSKHVSVSKYRATHCLWITWNTFNLFFFLMLGNMLLHQTALIVNITVHFHKPLSTTMYWRINIKMTEIVLPCNLLNI